jgi:Tfp pilus assembly protein PilF
MTILAKRFRSICVLMLALLCACAQTPVVHAPSNSPLFNDALFKTPSVAFDPQSVFKITPAMRDFINKAFSADKQTHNATQKLFTALYDKAQLKLDYDSSYTRNAIEAFEAKSGNCLSLVLMTAAFAKELGLMVRYQTVYTPENISRDEQTIYYSSHLNIVLGKAGVYDSANGSAMVIDFLTPKDAGKQRATVVKEQTVLSMYMNNRAVEELQLKRLDSAYWWAKQAIVNAPDFVPAYNTLAIVYERHGNLPEAERVLRHALALDATNHAVLSNLSQLMLELGNREEAAHLQRLLQQVSPTPPFHYFDLGMTAMKRKDYRSARDYFTQEIRRAELNAEFHYWLAIAHIELNEVSSARKHLIIAKENALTAKEQALYSAKLSDLHTSH